MDWVRDFLDKGKLVAPDLYSRLDELDEDEIEELAQSSSLVLTNKDLKRANVPEPEILDEGNSVKEHVHVSDFTSFYLERFNFLKDEIKEKLEGEGISSMNKLSSGEASVIGMVRKVEDGEVVLEDNTGEIVLKTDKKFLEDEVIGAKGEVIMDDRPKMAPEKIFYPDVPLDKDVRTTEEELKALFISELSDPVLKKLDELDPDYVFVSGENTEGLEDSDVPVISLVEDPVWVRIEDMEFLLHSGEAVEDARKKLGFDERKTMISLLKKRHLLPSKIHSLEDRYLLEEIPDVVHVNGEGSMANYKGVTLLSTSSDKAFLLDLNSRDIKEVEL